MSELADRPEEEDEKPVVVVLRTGDLTEEEAQRLQIEEESASHNKGKGYPKFLDRVKSTANVITHQCLITSKSTCKRMHYYYTEI